MIVVSEADVPVHYGFMFIVGADPGDRPHLEATYAGQQAAHRPSFAVPAIFAAVDPDALQAVIDSFSHAEATFAGHADDLMDRLRARFPVRPRT